MPGIAALAQPQISGVKTAVGAMLGRMRHYEWIRTDQHSDEAVGVGLGVATLDGPSSQGRLAHRDTSWIALDGELYEISDPAVALLEGWLKSGERSLTPIHGMFSAVIWDAASRELVVITDRFGMRPIYVATAKDRFAAASEIKSLLTIAWVDRGWSEAGVADFFAFGHFFNEHTFFRGVRAVPPATCLRYRVSDGRVLESRYWIARVGAERTAERGSVKRLEVALGRAVERRAGEGERLGLSLSGGLDARTILGLMPPGRNLKSVSIGIPGSIDHRGASKLAELSDVPHTQEFLDANFLSNFERHLRDMIALTDGHYLDQGIVMPTLPTYRKLGIDYLLRGHAGELLHMRKAYAFSLDDTALRASSTDLETWLWSHLTDYMLGSVPNDLFAIDVRGFARDSLRKAIGRTGEYATPVDSVWPLFVTQRLHRETAVSMQMFGNFATIRMPYIDNDVVDALYDMPASLKLGDELQTIILRHRRPAFLDVVNSNTGARVGAHPMVAKAAHFRMRVSAKLGLPGYQPYERLGLWLRRELKPLVERVVLSEELATKGMFNRGGLRRVVSEHFSGTSNHTFLLMALLIFELGQRSLAEETQQEAKVEFACGL